MGSRSWSSSSLPLPTIVLTCTLMLALQWLFLPHSGSPSTAVSAPRECRCRCLYSAADKHVQAAAKVQSEDALGLPLRPHRASGSGALSPAAAQLQQQLAQLSRSVDDMTQKAAQGHRPVVAAAKQHSHHAQSVASPSSGAGAQSTAGSSGPVLLHASKEDEFAKMVAQRKHPYFNSVLISETNSGYHEMSVSFLYHVRNAFPRGDLANSTITVALDKPEFEKLKGLKVPTYLVELGFDTKAQNRFCTPAFNRIVHNKWRIALSVLRMGVNVLISDSDVVFLRNPLPYFHTLPDCDFYMGQAGLDQPNEENFKPGKHGDVNTGVMYFRSNPRTIALVKEMLELAMSKVDETKGCLHDQVVFNTLLKQKHKASVLSKAGGDSKRSKNRHKCTNYGDFSFYYLSPVLFSMWPQFQGGVMKLPNDYIREDLPGKADILPYALHFNWLEGYANKQRGMKAFKKWHPSLD